jgi:putative DNA primase/helicase
MMHKDKTIIAIPTREQLEEQGIEIPDEYTLLIPEGVFRQSNNNKIHLSGPAWIHASTEDINSGINGAVIKFIDRRGKLKERAFPQEIFHEQNNALATILANEGLMIVPGKEKLLKEYLGSFNSNTWISSVSSIGWLDTADGVLSYLFPGEDGLIASGEQEAVIYQPEHHSPSVETITAKGTLEEWQNNVAIPCKGNPVLIAVACVPFAAVLLKHSELQNAGFHFYGDSSTGKTTAAQIAASCIGCGADPSDTPDKAYIQRWNTTENALEGVLYAHNDAPLILDEIQTYAGKDFGRAIHNITSGRSKNRMTKYTSLQPQRAWRNLMLSTGEISTRQKIEEENKQVHAGMSVRLIDVPVHRGVVIDPHGQSSDEFVRLLKQNCGRYHGTAIPAFIKRLITQHENAFALRGIIGHRLSEVAERLTPADAESVHRRAIKYFALLEVTGQIAVELGILPLSAQEISEAIDYVVKEWWLYSVNMSDRRRGIENIKAFMIKEGTRFAEIVDDNYDGKSTPVLRQAGYIKYQKGMKLYLFTEDALREACREYDFHQVLKEVDKLGMLFRNDQQKYKSKFTIPGFDKRRPFYAIDEGLLSEDSEQGHEGQEGQSMLINKLQAV